MLLLLELPLEPAPPNVPASVLAEPVEEVVDVDMVEVALTLVGFYEH